MVLRRKPDALISVLPTLRDSQKYHGQDKLPVTIWMITQVSEKQQCISIAKGFTRKMKSASCYSYPNICAS